MNDLLDGEDVDPEKPKAFLNYVLFEEDGSIYAEGSGRFQASGNGTWERIGTGESEIIMPRSGYLAIYLSNESSGGMDAVSGESSSDVFFDVMGVEVLRGLLMEENHYYPFGLPMKDLWSTRAGFKNNRSRYQDNEYITENGLNWMDFNFRQLGLSRAKSKESADWAVFEC